MKTIIGFGFLRDRKNNAHLGRCNPRGRILKNILSLIQWLLSITKESLALAMDYNPMKREACFHALETEITISKHWPDGLLSSCIDFFFLFRKDMLHCNEQIITLIDCFSSNPSSSYTGQRDCKQRRYLVASPVACMGYAWSNFATKTKRLLAVFHIDDHILKYYFSLFVCLFVFLAAQSKQI